MSTMLGDAMRTLSSTHVPSIGRGSYATCFPFNNTAIKCYKGVFKLSDCNSVIKELNASACLKQRAGTDQHPNLMLPELALPGPEWPVAIGMQLADGNIVQYMQKFHGDRCNIGCLPPQKVESFTIAALRGLEYLHRHDLVHADVAPLNFLVVFLPGVSADAVDVSWVDEHSATSDTAMVEMVKVGVGVKLTDFGFTMSVDPCRIVPHDVTTIWFRDPIALMDDPCVAVAHTDTYSLVATVAYLMQGKGFELGTPSTTTGHLNGEVVDSTCDSIRGMGVTPELLEQYRRKNGDGDLTELLDALRQLHIVTHRLGLPPSEAWPSYTEGVKCCPRARVCPLRLCAVESWQRADAARTDAPPDRGVHTLRAFGEQTPRVRAVLAGMLRVSTVGRLTAHQALSLFEDVAAIDLPRPWNVSSPLVEDSAAVWQVRGVVGNALYRVLCFLQREPDDGTRRRAMDYVRRYVQCVMPADEAILGDRLRWVVPQACILACIACDADIPMPLVTLEDVALQRELYRALGYATDVQSPRLCKEVSPHRDMSSIQMRGARAVVYNAIYAVLWVLKDHPLHGEVGHLAAHYVRHYARRCPVELTTRHLLQVAYDACVLACAACRTSAPCCTVKDAASLPPVLRNMHAELYDAFDKRSNKEEPIVQFAPFAQREAQGDLMATLNYTVDFEAVREIRSYVRKVEERVCASPTADGYTVRRRRDAVPLLLLVYPELEVSPSSSRHNLPSPFHDIASAHTDKVDWAYDSHARILDALHPRPAVNVMADGVQCQDGLGRIMATRA